MSRLERNRLRRQQKRRKSIFLCGIVLCLFILAGGVILTNDVMAKRTSLPREQNLFYYENLVKGIEENANYMLEILREVFIWLENKILYIYDYLTVS